MDVWKSFVFPLFFHASLEVWKSPNIDASPKGHFLIIPAFTEIQNILKILDAGSNKDGMKTKNCSQTLSQLAISFEGRLGWELTF